MKNIYKIKLSPFFLFLIFLSLISGLFRDIITLFIIIIIHEIGHVISSNIYKWKINKIEITICGGFITYDDIIDKPFKEEFIIAISGFLMQIILFITCTSLCKIGLIDSKLLFIINKYNTCILLFNLLPIYPLDGSKVLMIILNKFFPYKKSLKLINLISLFNIFIVILLLFKFNYKIEYSYIIICLFVIYKIDKHIKDIPYLFNRLLFERYEKPINTNKYNYIKGNNLNQFKRQKKNLFKINNRYVSEKVILSKKFD